MTVSPPAKTPTDLFAAIYHNQWTWVQRIGAIDLHGDPCETYEADSVMAARTGTTGAIMLAANTAADRSAITGAIDWLRAAGSGDALVWSAVPDPDADAWLLAHGAQEHFTPRWMSRSAAQPVPEAPYGPAIISPVRMGDLPSLQNATELPYYSPWQVTAVVQLATRNLPGSVALVVARAGGEIAGRGVLNLAESEVGTTAGIYDVGVSPAWQRQGIGRQLVHTLLALARDRGADVITLNATPAGEPLYQSLGFEDAGEGQTWLLPTAVLRHPPSETHVQFALRVAHGESLAGMASLAWLLLPSRETPLAMAARFGQEETARELLGMGTVPDIAALWELGLEDEALETMRRHPQALNARHGAKQVAPMHLAVFWDDLELLEALLEHGADPNVRDGTFDADARGWCHALGNEEALAILDAHITARLPW